jgi:SnoaL-like domain
MFQNATFRIDHLGSQYQGAPEILEFLAHRRLYSDGTPRTKHVLTNVIIEVDGDNANARSYVTVFQQTDALPLQPIACGRYVDRFERVSGEWRFTDRRLAGFLLGDGSAHAPLLEIPAPDRL